MLNALLGALEHIEKASVSKVYAPWTFLEQGASLRNKFPSVSRQVIPRPWHQKHVRCLRPGAKSRFDASTWLLGIAVEFSCFVAASFARG